MKDAARFQGHTVLITGGAAGIGESAARRFALEGATVLIADRDTNVETVAAGLQADLGATAVAYTYDQRDPDSIDALLASIDGSGRSVDVLFANAGFSRLSPLASISRKEWQTTIDVNLSGTFFICQGVAKRMIASGRGGVIVLTASICGHFAGNQLAHYCASKAAVLMLGRCLAAELGPHRIRVNTVSPGVVETGMTRPLLDDPGTSRMVRRSTPLGRWASPDEIADAVAYLASSDAAFVNGQDLLVDGGLSDPVVPAWRPLDYAEEGSSDFDAPMRRYPFAE